MKYDFNLIRKVISVVEQNEFIDDIEIEGYSNYTVLRCMIKLGDYLIFRGPRVMLSWHGNVTARYLLTDEQWDYISPLVKEEFDDIDIGLREYYYIWKELHKKGDI